MLIVHVHVHVISDQVDAFKTITMENAQNSIKESGIARFDVIQSQDDPSKFVLVEVYRSIEATAKHKETVHYQKWRDAVASMMVEPRTSYKYTNLFPGENEW